MTRLLTILFALSLLVSCSESKPTDHAHVKTLIKTGYQTNLRMDTISTDLFWKLMDDAVKTSPGNDESKQKYLEAALKKLPANEINAFEFGFRKVIIDADDFKIMAAQKIIEGGVTDDSYLYFRCWLAGQGKTVYTETLNNPEYLADVVKKGDKCQFEELMNVSTHAYSAVTGKDEDESFPRELAYGRGLDYDLGAPVTKGKDWKENELPGLYPKLWAKFK